MRNCPRCGQSSSATENRCNRCGQVLPDVAAPSQSVEVPPLGTLFESTEHFVGNYRVVRPLAVDWFGSALEVEQGGKRFVLVHLTNRNQEGSTHKSEMFLRECQALSELDNPHLPTVNQFFVQAGEFFLLLDSVEGTSLLEIVYPENRETTLRQMGKRRLPNLERVLRWSTQLAETLLYLHRQRPFPMLQRNLNPLTVRITPQTEEIYLLRCGLLNSFLPITTHQSDGNLVPLSPDPFADPLLIDKYWIDSRVDIYAFGRVLDFLLTGVVPPYPGAPPTFPTSDMLVGDSRTRLAEIITCCCQASPVDRYPTVSALLAAIEAVSLDSSLEPSERVACDCGHLNRPSSRLCERCGQRIYLFGQTTQAAQTIIPMSITYDNQVHDTLLSQYQRGYLAPLGRFRLREALDEAQSDPGFDELVSLASLPLVEKLPHQREAALTALKQMRGRALLADEVGLGKTIETSIILKELVLRGLASRILIFCPVQLLGQWQSELYEKFDETFLVFGRDIDTSLAWHCPRLIAPYETVRHRFHAEELLRQRYDLVILDEAHYLNYEENERILRVMKSLQKKYFLLLSATPMHNSLDELYNIITLLRPGHLDDLANFRQQFVDPENPTLPRNLEQLRGYLQAVMIRNSRRQVMKEYPFPERDPHTVVLQLDGNSAKFYQAFRDFYKKSLADNSNRRFLLRMSELVERFCSSSEAFRAPINQLKQDRYAHRHLGREFFHQLESFSANYPPSFTESKIRAMEQTLRTFIDQGQSVLVFSQFNETARSLYHRMRRTDIAEHCLLYNEEDPPLLRLKSLSDLRDTHAGILFCPGEASEGLNLQFASVMINFDLPWDPMKLEQRIGRIQRIGGRQRITIVNLVLQGTIEEEIFKICQDKIKMFSDVIGQVEEILGNLREEDDFRAMICDSFLERHVEAEEGESIAAQVYLEQALQEAIEKSSTDDATNALNMIFFDFSESDES